MRQRRVPHVAGRRERWLRSQTCTRGLPHSQTSSRAPENRRAKGMGKDVVDVKMQLRDDADVVSRGAIDGDDRLYAKLYGLARPQDAGIDRASGAPAVIIHRR